MADLYGSDNGAISMGNARMSQVRDYNDRIATHNKTVTDTITGLKEQASTRDNVKSLQETAQGLWAGKGMPDKLKAYQDWRAKRNGGETAPNPTDDTAQTQTPAPTEGGDTPAVAGDNDAGGGEPVVDEPPAEPIAEGSNTASSVAEEEETTGGRFTKGVSRMTGMSEEALETAGKGVSILGAGAVAGSDLYNDFKKGGWSSMNTEEKTGNIMQIGGAAMDIVGTVFPPAALLGGILDLGAGAVDMVGDQVDRADTGDKLDAQGTAEQETGVSATAQTQTTGRTQ